MMTEGNKELPGVLIFPSRKLGQTGAKGRNPVADHNERILERLRGVPANTGPVDPNEPGNPNVRKR